MFEMPLETHIEIATPEDTARAFVKALEHRKELTGRVFNLGAGADCRVSYAEFPNRSFELMGIGKPSFTELRSRPGTFIVGITSTRQAEPSSRFSQ